MTCQMEAVDPGRGTLDSNCIRESAGLSARRSFNPRGALRPDTRRRRAWPATRRRRGRPASASRARSARREGNDRPRAGRNGRNEIAIFVSAQATTMPTSPPESVIASASIRNPAKIAPRVAPTARRVPISARRSRTDTSSTLATPTAPTNKPMPPTSPTTILIAVRTRFSSPMRSMLLMTMNSPLVSPRCFRSGSSTAFVAVVAAPASSGDFRRRRSELAFSLPRNAAAQALNGT